MLGGIIPWPALQNLYPELERLDLSRLTSLLFFSSIADYGSLTNGLLVRRIFSPRS